VEKAAYHLTQGDLARLGIEQKELTLGDKSPSHFFSAYRGRVEVPRDSYVKDEFPPREPEGDYEQDSASENAMALGCHLTVWFTKCNLPDKKEIPFSAGPGSFYSAIFRTLTHTPASSHGDFNFPGLCDQASAVRWEVLSAWPMREQKTPHMVVLMESASSRYSAKNFRTNTERLILNHQVSASVEAVEEI
jgi:hypothetical protein